MARRYTDSEKWRDEWWGSLPNDYRIVWLYLCDSCSHAGIWKKDIRGLNFNCNTEINYEELEKITGGRLIDCGSFYWIPKFVKFQNQHGIGSNKPMVVGIRREICDKVNSLIVKQQLPNDYLIIYKDGIGKGSGMGEGKEREEVMVSDDKPIVNQSLDSILDSPEYQATVIHRYSITQEDLEYLIERHRHSKIENSKVHTTTEQIKAAFDGYVLSYVKNKKESGSGVTKINGNDRHPGGGRKKTAQQQIMEDQYGKS